MATTKGLIAALAATTILTAGVALAAEQQAAGNSTQTTIEKDFTKLSADGSKAYQDLSLTRLAIYDGDTAKAKTYVDEADQAFAKAKGDDTVYMKAENELLTPQQMNAKQAQAKAAADAKTAAPAPADEAKPSTPAPVAAAPSDQAKATSVAWLPVDGAISLNEDYTLSPTKAKAVADANKSLAKGDSKGALDKLKLADVNMSVALEVVPLNQTITDVHQAASLIDSGKFYEGSQELRKVQVSARYDVSDYLAKPNGAVSASHASDADQAKEAPAPATH